MEKIIKYQKQIFIVLVAIIFFNFFSAIYSNKDHIFTKFDYKVWENKYNKSQWVVPQSKNEISDDDLYILLGSKIIAGGDPSLLSAEVPPLGKYLIGFSQQVTGIIGFYGIFFSALALFLFFKLNKILFKSNLLSIIPVLVFSFEKIFRDQIGVSLLDMQYLSLLFLIFIFILKRRFFISAISAGFFMATKSPFVVVILYMALYLYFLLQKKINIKIFIAMPLFTFITYVIVHVKLFILGHGFIYFLQVQKYMTNFYSTGAKGIIGAVFPMILGGYWFTWFGKDGFIKEWNVLWPIAFFLSIFAIFKLVKERKENMEFVLIGIWTVLYTAFLILTPIYSRYLLLLIPFMYNLAVWGLLKVLSPRLFGERSS